MSTETTNTASDCGIGCSDSESFHQGSGLLGLTHRPNRWVWVPRVRLEFWGKGRSQGVRARGLRWPYPSNSPCCAHWRVGCERTFVSSARRSASCDGDRAARCQQRLAAFTMRADDVAGQTQSLDLGRAEAITKGRRPVRSSSGPMDTWVPKLWLNCAQRVRGKRNRLQMGRFVAHGSVVRQAQAGHGAL